MKAVTWQGRRDMQVTDVPDPRIEEPTDAVVRITSTGLCGSDLHLYDPFTPFMEPGDVVGHEPMGVVEEVGAEVSRLKPGDRVVVPFNVSCGTCWTCSRGLHSQCETTQNRDQGTGASLFGYSKLYGQVPGGQAEAMRVPFADTLPIVVPRGSCAKNAASRSGSNVSRAGSCHRNGPSRSPSSSGPLAKKVPSAAPGSRSRFMWVTNRGPLTAITVSAGTCSAQASQLDGRCSE